MSYLCWVDYAVCFGLFAVIPAILDVFYVIILLLSGCVSLFAVCKFADGWV